MSNFLPVGTVLNGKRKYTIESTLHSGGFGNTYLVKGIVMDENIAQEATYTLPSTVRVLQTVALL